MPYQTTMNPNGKSISTPAEGVRRGATGLLHDVMTLAELQLKLLSVDAKAATGRAVFPIILIGAAAVFAASALPLLLVALAQLLRYQAEWPAALATVTAVMVGLAIAAGLGIFGYLGLKRCLEPMARSREEFERNVTWLKNALKRHEQQHAAAASGPAVRGATTPPLHPR